MAESLHPGDRVVVTRQDSPGRECWVGMSGTVVSLDDPDDVEEYSTVPVLVRVDQLEAAFHFAIDELRLVVMAQDLVAVGNG